MPRGRATTSAWSAGRFPPGSRRASAAFAAPRSLPSEAASRSSRRLSTTRPPIPYTAPTTRGRTTTPFASHRRRAGSRWPRSSERGLREQGVVDDRRGGGAARADREARALRDLDRPAAPQDHAPLGARAEGDLPLPLHEPDGDERLAPAREVEPMPPQHLERIGLRRPRGRQERRQLGRGERRREILGGDRRTRRRDGRRGVGRGSRLGDGGGGRRGPLGLRDGRGRGGERGRGRARETAAGLGRSSTRRRRARRAPPS